MVQNVILSARDRSLVIAGNNSSQFVNWLSEKFATPIEVSSSTVKGIMNKFDSLEHEGVIFRAELQNWLWENQGEEVKLEIK